MINQFNRPDRSYDILPYDPVWAIKFKELRERLKAVLGDIAILVEHIGSTAVPGMAAKPQIDVIVGVNNLEDVRTLKDKMADAGFSARGDFVGNGEEYFTEDDQAGHRLASIHIQKIDSPEIPKQIRFREYMRLNINGDRDLYELKKQELKQLFPDSYNAYGDGKRLLLEEIHQRCKKWAEEANFHYEDYINRDE
ncbi:GrpB family protein [Candidatus Saccharibacteria bacterium]|nr:GrpB family protein [Candidatus Saccharibacteria bacterium]MCB9821204.1 GrpB family protein [Candidatus Nomurabacteria bacterium]